MFSERPVDTCQNDLLIPKKATKERKRKLFHSKVYEDEIAMKKLYIQTAKRLAAYGCKVFQVKELLHGRTLRKVSESA
ncbi:hypothetical protein OESDEN_03081 [Oesophagostomum dentatum]|uniref:FERM domain-containing protein n=1 Tax=Oesophagostomum dentatum TaxID=61180 RepID=A0A0B1TLG5_OESDE|nr:hypothetical protein OESDEN_03081 [Oesophagostomum dentatum]